jgi:hypothetical protein
MSEDRLQRSLGGRLRIASLGRQILARHTALRSAGGRRLAQAVTLRRRPTRIVDSATRLARHRSFGPRTEVEQIAVPRPPGMSEFAARWIFGEGPAEGIPFGGGAAIADLAEASGPPSFLQEREDDATAPSAGPAAIIEVPRGRVVEVPATFRLSRRPLEPVDAAAMPAPADAPVRAVSDGEPMATASGGEPAPRVDEQGGPSPVHVEHEVAPEPAPAAPPAVGDDIARPPADTGEPATGGPRAASPRTETGPQTVAARPVIARKHSADETPIRPKLSLHGQAAPVARTAATDPVAPRSKPKPARPPASRLLRALADTFKRPDPPAEPPVEPTAPDVAAPGRRSVSLVRRIVDLADRHGDATAGGRPQPVQPAPATPIEAPAGESQPVESALPAIHQRADALPTRIRRLLRQDRAASPSAPPTARQEVAPGVPGDAGERASDPIGAAGPPPPPSDLLAGEASLEDNGLWAWPLPNEDVEVTTTRPRPAPTPAAGADSAPSAERPRRLLRLRPGARPASPMDEPEPRIGIEPPGAEHPPPAATTAAPRLLRSQEPEPDSHGSVEDAARRGPTAAVAAHTGIAPEHLVQEPAVHLPAHVHDPQRPLPRRQAVARLAVAQRTPRPAVRSRPPERERPSGAARLASAASGVVTQDPLGLDTVEFPAPVSDAATGGVVWRATTESPPEVPASPSGSAAPGSTPPPAPASAAQGGASIDDIYEQVIERLRRDLMAERERMGDLLGNLP